MLKPIINNLAPERFSFWLPPAGSTVIVGPDRLPVPLPSMPLPLHLQDMADGTPSDAAIGQGVYDYLRQFPDCAGNTVYAELLRDAYPHFISDLAAHAVMLDAKQVEPAFVARKLACLKILRLLDPHNSALLWQLSRGYFELALEFAELARCRQHLRDSMRFGQELLALAPADPQVLSLLAEIDLFFGDAPAATDKWRKLANQVGDSAVRARIETRIADCAGADCPEATLVDDLETLAEAMHLHAVGDDRQATFLLEQMEADGRLTTLLPSADFYWLLGVCRQGCGDPGGAFTALQQALAIEPDHAAARSALDSL